MRTYLGELSEALNKYFLNLQYDYRYDDPNDPNRFFFRSDHFNYARKGIPNRVLSLMVYTKTIIAPATNCKSPIT